MLVDKLHQLLTDKSESNAFSGAVLIRQEGSELFREAYGFANRAWNVETRVDTRFRVASISKLFTSVAILQLIERGKLNFDSSVIRCLGLTGTRIPATVNIYHLLTMTSGIADWFDESGNWQENWAALCREHPIYLFRENKDYLRLFVNDEPTAAVGDKHEYNNAGYILLGLVIERISGATYSDYVRRNVFEKACMSRSDFISLDGVDGEVAEGYVAISDSSDEIIGWKKNIYSAMPGAAGDGGATSTVYDLALFSQALRNHVLLNPEMTNELLTPKVHAEDMLYRGCLWKYGYGFQFMLGEDGRIVRYGLSGEEDGVSCRLYHYPEKRLDIIILGNQSWCAGSLAWELHDLLHVVDPSGNS